MSRARWLAAAALAAALAFHGPLLFGGALGGRDWASHHYHYFDWVRTSLRSFHTLPLYMADAWISPNFLANAEAPQLGPLVWLLLWLPTDAYLKMLIALFTAAGLGGMFQLLRDLEIAAPVAAFGAVAFAFDGFFVSHLAVGHPWVLGGYLLPGLVCLFRRATLGSARALLGAAALNAAAILGGMHQPFVWQNLFLALLAAAWAVRGRSLRPLATAAALAGLTAGLAAVKLIPLLAEFSAYHPTQRTAALPPALLLPSLLARGQHPGWAPPGLAFAHGSGWWEWAFYRGPLALTALAVGLAAARRCRSFALVGACFALLALAWPRPLAGLEPWPLLQDLPVWRTQRSPSRLLFLGLFGLSVTSAAGLQRLWARAAPRAPRLLPLAAAALALLLAADLLAESLAWQRAARGAALASRDHRPRPLAMRGEDASARLVGFAPNRLVYRVAAARETRVVLPLRLREGSSEWRVDGGRAVSLSGRLAVEVPAGPSELVLRYRPTGFAAGLAVSGLSAALISAAALRRRAASA